MFIFSYMSFCALPKTRTLYFVILLLFHLNFGKAFRLESSHDGISLPTLQEYINEHMNSANFSKFSFSHPLHHKDAKDSPFRVEFHTASSKLTTYQISDRLRGVTLAKQATRKSTRNARKLLDIKQKLINAWRTSGGYFVKLTLGTRKKDQYLIFDTGSTLSWLQCQCESCEKPSNTSWKATYNPSESKTFSTVKCGERACKLPDVRNSYTKSACDSTKDPDSEGCPYAIDYVSGRSSGVLSRDVLTMQSLDKKSRFAFRFTFGCEYRKRNKEGHLDHAMDLYGANGVVGAGRAVLALPSQMRRYYNNVFSTCLVDPDVSSNSTVLYGSVAVPKSGVVFTPMFKNPADSIHIFYYVKVDSVLVDNHEVKFPSSAFRIHPGEPATGTVLDTGTTYALLKPPEWQAIFDVVKSNVKKASLTSPVDDGAGGHIEPCWIHSPESVYPTITFILKDGVRFELQPSDYIYKVDESTVCNVIQKSSDVGINILGSMFMANKLIVWDRERERIGIKPMNCATATPL